MAKKKARNFHSTFAELMRIRLAKQSDAVELAKLHRGTIRSENAKDYPDHVIEGWSGASTAKRFRDSHETRVRYVAVEGERIIGFGEIGAADGNMCALYVHKDWIGKGVGKKLFFALEKKAKSMGTKKFHFDSSLTARKFYEACGCKTLGKVLFRLSSGEEMEAYKMEKIL